MRLDGLFSAFVAFIETELLPSYGPTPNQPMSSSTMSVFCARQFTACSKLSSVPDVMLKYPNQISAPGAKSCTISDIAVPSAPAPASVGVPEGALLHVVVFTAGKSPLACD